jgi:hypothetical protein
MSIPPVNTKIVRCELLAGLVCEVDRTRVKLFTIGLVRMGSNPLPALFDHASTQ